jgi:leucyl aminopeptidase
MNMQTKFITKVFPEGQNRLTAQMQLPVDCLILPLNQLGSGDRLVVPKSFEKLDGILDGMISAMITSKDFVGKLGETYLINQQKSWKSQGLHAKRILFVGLGDHTQVSQTTRSAQLLTDYAKAARAALKVVMTTQAASVLWLLEQGLDTKQDDLYSRVIRQTILLVEEASYRFGLRFKQFKTKPAETPIVLKTVTFGTTTQSSKQLLQIIGIGSAIAQGLTLTKDLANLPANVCTPTYLAKTAQGMAKKDILKVEVLERKDIEQLGMGAFLSVTQGSVSPPKFIILKHLGGKSGEAPIVLVGKGITFDTGGISLKPGEGMDEMKYDMCGAATVLGLMQAVTTMKLKKNVIGVIPTCENMPSATATRPGDIVTTMSGQTVEILNTDAEGRLILCDALTYVERFKPRAVIDIATLTGACVIALGHVHAGLFSKSEPLTAALQEASQFSLDTLWHMPMDDAYQDQLKSNFADMANIGGRAAGSVTAACYLSRFTQAYDWAHLDIAGVAWRSGPAKGATGRPVPLLAEYLLKA